MVCLLVQRSLHTRHLVVLGKDIGQRSNRRNLELIDLAVALGVVLLDVLEICGFLEGRVVLFFCEKSAKPYMVWWCTFSANGNKGAWQKKKTYPVQMPQPFVDVRVSRADITNVALEVLDVNGIEADNGGIKPDICFCDVRCRKEVWG